MAPTSDERREVAERLRDCIVYAKKHDLNGDCDMGSDKCVETRNTLYNDIASCIEEYGNFNLSAEEVFTRLSDLIDPTCHVIPGKEAVAELKDGTRLTGVLLSCGHAVFGVSAKDMPRFCCECGARITNEGEG